eukprot:TRINITY_DN3855_c1_g1_i1.p1 TRINITY_DN3855_c1_g1~~TRINITY_DN3855_c1_g1_i1.p1  ORF type:complete len:276 (+),score=149.16 TRINITY_DN3855_c1_g1_i1:45-872(+)
MAQKDYKAAAEKLYAARANKGWVDGAEMDALVESLDDINAVNKALFELPGRAPIGFKIGLNFPEGGFKKVGLSEPFVAPLYKENLRENGAALDPQYITGCIGVAEGEWGFVTGKDFAPQDALPEVEGMWEYVEEVGCAIEIASTCVGPKAPGSFLKKLADHGACHSVVYQAVAKAETFSEELVAQLPARTAALFLNGAEAVPATALPQLQELHRAFRLVQKQGYTIPKGSLIITGAAVKVPGLKAGDKLSIRFEHPIEQDETVEVSCSVGDAGKL